MTTIIMPTINKETAMATAELNHQRAGIDAQTLVIVDKARRGYTAMVNKALNEVLDDVCIVVDDAVMSEGWLLRFINAAKKYDAWFVGPSTECRTPPQNQGKPGDTRKPQFVDHISGVCLYATREAVRRLGPMDERMIHYGSDVDWQWQGQLLGGKTLWVPDVWCEHELHEPSFPDWWRQDNAMLGMKWPDRMRGRQMKIFGLGIGKTGTVSLNQALRRLGLNAKHYADPDNIMEEAARYDALTDTPHAIYYKVLDVKYPNAKFILTVRDIDDWLDSNEAHYARRQVGDKPLRHRKRLWGIDHFNREVFRRVYEAHIADVRAHFYTRPDKVLTMNICAGDGYEKLCPFLGLEVIDEPFPHLNKRPE